jgi:hypothetical protein
MDCYYRYYDASDSAPISVVPTITVGAVTVSPTVISTSQDATVRIMLAASSGVVNTNNVSVEVGISEASGPFRLSITPATQGVALGGGQSDTYTFNVHVASRPAANRTCKFNAHVTFPQTAFVVVGNDTVATPTVTILAN